MIRINLLPVKAAQKKEMLMGQLTVVVLALVVAVAICVAAYLHITGQVDKMQSRIDQKQAEIQKLQKVIKEVKDFEKRQKDLRAKLNVLEKLKTARTGPVVLLDELFLAIPEKLWLTKFEEKSGIANISGIGSSEEVVALFMRNLEASKSYEGVELKVTKQVTMDKVKFHQFDLTSKTTNGSEKSKANQKE